MAAIETSIEGRKLTLTFANGKTLVMDSQFLPSEILDAAIMHGLKQKLCDAAAMSRDTETGKPASIDDKYAAVKEVFDSILSGEWNRKRSAGESSTGGYLVRALVSLYNGVKTEAQIVEFLASKSPAEQTALRKSPKIAAIIETLRPAAKSSVKADELLSLLEGTTASEPAPEASPATKKPSKKAKS